MDLYYLQHCVVFNFDGKMSLKLMKTFFQTNRVWDIVQTGFIEPIEDTELSINIIQELERNIQLDRKALHYFSTKVQLHVLKKFMRVKIGREA